MIEYIIQMTERDSKKLAALAEKAGLDDESEYLISYVMRLLDYKAEDSMRIITTDDSQRLEYTEK